ELVLPMAMLRYGPAQPILGGALGREPREQRARSAPAIEELLRQPFALALVRRGQSVDRSAAGGHLSARLVQESRQVRRLELRQERALLAHRSLHQRALLLPREERIRDDVDVLRPSAGRRQRGADGLLR